MSLSAGTKLGLYEILAPIGAGGMGEVYRARDTKLGRDVAIKVLPEAFAENKERLARFEREARLLASLNHPNIATLFDLRESDGVHFLVLEFVPGETLAERITRGPIPIDDALPLFKQIAEGLEAAHEKGVIHRDLKPANIKITPEGRIKVLDFGLAKAWEKDSSTQGLSESPTVTKDFTEAGVLLGTAPYMSPEQARGKPVDKRTDIWAFGCCLYQALTGKTAFLGDTVTDTIVKIVEREPDWDALPATTSKSIRRVLLRCLQKDSHNRLHDMADVRIEIEDTDAEPSTPVLSAFKTKITTLLKVGLAGLIAGLALGAVLVWNLILPGQAPMSEIFRFDINLPEDLSLDSEYHPIALSPNQRILVFAATSGHSSQLYVRNLDSLETRPIPGTEGGGSPFFSPDSKWVGFFAGGRLNKISLDGSVLVTLCDVSTDPNRGASWGDDGHIVFAQRRATALYRVSANGGTPQQIKGIATERGEMEYSLPEVLPGSDTIIFTADSASGFANKDIVAFSMTTGERRTLIEGGASSCYVSSGHLVFSQLDSLMAVRFDVERLEVSGLPVPVLQDVEHDFHTENTLFGVSDEGLLVYVPAQATPESSLVWSDRYGNLTPIRVEPRNYWGPSLSPDGERVAMTTSDRIMETWILELDRDAVNKFTFDGSNHITVWTPDGESLVFSSNREGPHNLFWKPADGSGAAERLSVSDQHQDPSSFTPDGKVLAFAQDDPDTNWDIWLLHMDTERREEAFLRTEFDEYHPMISPDGNWLAYASNESGRYEVYVQPFPGGGRKWLISTEGGTAPLWERDGKELFYRNGEKLLTVSVETEPTFATEKPRLLFEAPTRARSSYGPPDYDVSPDGQRFLMVPNRTRTPRKRIHVVLNWAEELKRLVPTN